MILALKSATFSTYKDAPKIALETTYFMLFYKNLSKNSEKKLVFMFILMEHLNFTYIFLLHITFFCYWKKLSHHAWPEINCVYETLPLIFSTEYFILFVFVKKYY